MALPKRKSPRQDLEWMASIPREAGQPPVIEPYSHEWWCTGNFRELTAEEYIRYGMQPAEGSSARSFMKIPENIAVLSRADVNEIIDRNDLGRMVSLSCKPAEAQQILRERIEERNSRTENVQSIMKSLPDGFATMSKKLLIEFIEQNGLNVSRGGSAEKLRQSIIEVLLDQSEA